MYKLCLKYQNLQVITEKNLYYQNYYLFFVKKITYFVIFVILKNILNCVKLQCIDKNISL